MAPRPVPRRWHASCARSSGCWRTRCHPLLQLRHHYADRAVALEVFVVEEYTGAPMALEGQALQWVGLEELAQQALLPADRPICRCNYCL